MRSLAAIALLSSCVPAHVLESARDRDSDGFEAWQLGGPDCDDSDQDVHPGADEICGNGVDDDCDGNVDDDGLGATVFYTDADGDGHGDLSAPVTACAIREGLSESTDDCNDGDAAVSPSAEEVCRNGVDDNCDGEPFPCGFYGDIDMSQADVVFVDTMPYAMAGGALATGDLDADGIADLVVSAGIAGVGLPGSVHVLRGSTTLPSLMTPADAWFSQFGEPRGGIATCDIDGDDRLDLLTWYSWWDDLYSQWWDSAITAFTSLPPMGSPDIVIGYIDDEVELPSWFFRCVDFTGDGVPEVLTSTLLFNDPTLRELYVVPGPMAGQVSVDSAIAHWGEPTGAPIHVSNAADLDGDGADDVLVSVPDEQGVFLARGDDPGTHTWQASAKVVSTTTTGDTLGGSPAIGDFDGDGWLDIAVPTEGATGSVFIWYGPVTVDGKLTVDTADATIAPFFFEQVGDPVALGDVTGDGVTDLLITTAYSEQPGESPGIVYLFNGGDRWTGERTLFTADARFLGEALGDHSGEAVAVADLNGDGYGDLAIGSRLYGHVVELGGAVYVFFGTGI